MMNYSTALLSSMTASALQAMAAAAQHNPNILPGIKRTEVFGLPQGWIREEISTKLYGFHNGATSGNKDYEVAYYSPKGHRVQSKAEMARLLGDSYDLSSFDFYSGKIYANSSRGRNNSSNFNHSYGQSRNNSQYNKHGHRIPTPSKSHPKSFQSTKNSQDGSSHKISKSLEKIPSNGIQNDCTIITPIRQTASIFKQPVTVITNFNEESATKKSVKSDSIDRPHQLFWEKRLFGLRASYPEEEYQPFELPESLRPIGPGIDSGATLVSISTSLHLNNKEVKGQSEKAQIEYDPIAFLEPEQPLYYGSKVSYEDIEKEEQRVHITRKKLASALSSIEY